MTHVNRLSNREWDVVKLLLQGKSNKLIASSLGISSRTVEFHLKNIYAKYQVSSRMELVLKLASAPAGEKIGKLGDSTVVGVGEKAENGAGHNSGTNWAPSLMDTVSILDKEPKMKKLVFTKQALVGWFTAYLAGFLWVAVLSHFGHMSLNSILPWLLPLAVTLALIGLSVGYMGNRNRNSLLKISFSSLFGTGVGAFAMIPVVAVVVYPLGKLAESLGLINRSAIPTDVTSTLVIVSMLAIWLVVGIAIGILLLHVGIKRTHPANLQMHPSKHGM